MLFYHDNLSQLMTVISLIFAFWVFGTLEVLIEQYKRAHLEIYSTNLLETLTALLACAIILLLMMLGFSY